MPSSSVDDRESTLATAAFCQVGFRARFASSVALLSVVQPVLEARNTILS